MAGIPNTSASLDNTDARRVALICIDLQVGDSGRAAALDPASTAAEPSLRYYHDQIESVVIPNVRELQHFFRERGLEVIHVRIRSLTADGRDRSLQHKRLGVAFPPDSPLSDFLPEVAPRRDLDEIVINKTASGAFLSTRMRSVLNNLGITAVVLCGVRTQECVESSARQASDLGYDVTIARDACATLSEKLHNASLDTLDKRYANVTTVRAVVEQLSQSVPLRLAEDKVIPPAALAGSDLAAAALPVSSATVRAVDVRGERVHELLVQHLGAIGGDSGGPNGTTRLTFSQHDCDARAWLQRVALEEFGADRVEVDTASNVRVWFDAAEVGAPCTVMGSHIDTVRRGGNFDGCLGVIGALEAARAVRAARGGRAQMRRALLVVAFTDEEATLLGSKAFAGLPVDVASLGALPSEVLDELGLDEHADTLTAWRAALHRVGGDVDRLAEARAPAEADRYFELHIEQGPVLVDQSLDVGIVSCIVGLRNYRATFLGTASHAGATRMCDRADALAAAAEFIVAVRSLAAHLARTVDDTAVATVGYVDVLPNQPSAVPGRVVLSVDMRAGSMALLDRLDAAVRQALRTALANSPRVQCEAAPDGSLLHLHHATEAVDCDRGGMALLAAAAGACSLSSRVLPSRAGHDAQNVARLMPAAMLFVPSETKVSHSPDEFSTAKQVADGVRCLASALDAL